MGYLQSRTRYVLFAHDLILCSLFLHNWLIENVRHIDVIEKHFTEDAENKWDEWLYNCHSAKGKV